MSKRRKDLVEMEGKFTPVESSATKKKKVAIATVAGLVGSLAVVSVAVPTASTGIYVGLVASIVLFLVVANHYKNESKNQELPEKKALSPEIYKERSKRILAILHQEGVCTFDDLLKKSKFFEKALIETLKKMLEDSFIEEELDMDTGSWHYKISNRYQEMKIQESISMDLDSRWEELNK